MLLNAMFLKNTTKNDIGPITFEGFEFTLPADSVCAIYTPAGEHFTTRLFRIEAEDPRPPKWQRGVNIGGDGGSPIPPVIPVEESDWDGKTYAMVTRFKIDSSRIPDRQYLLQLADDRGVDKEILRRFDRDNTENGEIAAEINKLSVPEGVRIPEELKVNKKKENA